MIEILINKCHGGFGISNEVITRLVMSNSSLITRISFEEFFGTSALSQDDIDDMQVIDIGNGYYIGRWGTVYHPETETVLQIGSDRGTSNEDGVSNTVLTRTHPDLISLFDEMGYSAFSGPYARVAKVVIDDEDITLKDIEIGEYDGAEWVMERHRTWP